MTGLRHLLTTLAGDDAVRVIVFDSAEPDFFLAHVDMTATPEALAGLMADLPDGVNVFQAVGEQVRHQPQVTIVKLAGQARGGGAEFVTAADLAFAAIGRAGLGRIEALTGIIPGGGATVRPGQPRRPAGALDEFVDRLAGTIAALPDGWAGLLFRPGTAQLMGAGLAHGADP